MGKILVVEDDKKISRILKLQLERENHEIVIIENGIDALNEIDKKREFYDLILLDLGLPLIEGNEVCKNVRKISEVPIIVISAKNNIDEPILLTKTEFELVKLLIENKEEIVSRDKIIEKIWGWEASDNLLDSTMKKIRQKLGKEKIKTVRGIGYILKI